VTYFKGKIVCHECIAELPVPANS
jgi:hypothetical protein